MGYDMKCGELAFHFLKDYEQRIPPDQLTETQAALAQEIQDAVETFLSAAEAQWPA